MRSKSILAVVMVAVLATTGISQAVTIDLVTVGNSGNADDATGYGAVGYEYSIGKYEVTAGILFVIFILTILLMYSILKYFRRIGWLEQIES